MTTTTEDIKQYIETADAAALCELASRIDELPELWWLHLCLCVDTITIGKEVDSKRREALAVLHSRFSKREAARYPQRFCSCVVSDMLVRGNLILDYGEPETAELSEHALWALVETEITRFDTAALRECLPGWQEKLILGEISLEMGQSIMAIRSVCSGIRWFVPRLPGCPPLLAWWLANPDLLLPETE